MTVVVPTLRAGETLRRCLTALEAQSFEEFETIVVDNSGTGMAAEFGHIPGVRILASPGNAGFAGAINRAASCSQAQFIATLNDDARPSPHWLARLVAACRGRNDVGMCASQVRLSSSASRLDSAGLNIYLDGTTKQRGHDRPAAEFARDAEALLPSGCAALYRRDMLDQIGGFDDDYFLYGEDADVGLRARWAGWKCLYVAGAVVEHDYSATSGRASALKTYYVERNRIYTVVKSFPLFLWPVAPWYSLWRYAHHLWSLLTRRGLAGDFRGDGGRWWQLGWMVASAHAAALRAVPRLLRKRRLVGRMKQISNREFLHLLRKYYIAARDIAAQ